MPKRNASSRSTVSRAASLENIAAGLGISRHNLLYYYPSKEGLYRAVLDEVLAEWLQRMEGMVAGARTPRPRCASTSRPSCASRASGWPAPRSSHAR